MLTIKSQKSIRKPPQGLQHDFPLQVRCNPAGAFQAAGGKPRLAGRDLRGWALLTILFLGACAIL
jgi:hypothetical protein